MRSAYMLFIIGTLFVSLSVIAQVDPSGRGNAKPEANVDAKSSTKGNANSKSPTLPNGITFHAELTKSLETTKAKVGDLVNAKITEELSDGTIQIHKGSKLVGHVTKAQAYTKQNGEASLTIAFDKVVLREGQEIAFQGTMEEYQRPTPITASGIPWGVGASSDPANQSMRPVDRKSGEPYDDARTTVANWNPGGGFSGSGDQRQKARGSGFASKSNFKLETGALIVVRVQ